MNIFEWEVEHVRRFGSAEGLIARGRTWTNIELHAAACNVGWALHELGLMPGDRVAILLSNSAELYVACSAVWMAGGVTVVLGDRPQAEYEQLFRHCDAAFVVSDSAGSRSPGEFAVVRDVVVSNLRSKETMPWPELAKPFDGASFVPAPRNAGDPAQICYTSGTSGAPRAIVYTHGSTIAHIRTRIAHHSDSEKPRVVLVALPPTAFGARLITTRLAGRFCYVLHEQFSPRDVFEAIQRHCVNDLPLVPAMAEQLAAWHIDDKADLSSLEIVNLGGAHVPARLVSSLHAHLSRRRTAHSSSHRDSPGLTIRVVYGMTEAGGTIARTSNGGDGLVGRVEPGVEVRIVNGKGNCGSPQEMGEIEVRTPFAATAYFNDPQASEEVFRHGFVRTGDLGYLRNGELYVLGRVKEVIIQGGENIYPNEIANVVRLMHGVSDCAVVGAPDALLGEAAVACVVLSSAQMSAQEVRRHCRGFLNSRKLPAYVLFLDELPRNRAGKIDTTVLRNIVSEHLSCTATDNNLVSELCAGNAEQRATMIAGAIRRVLHEVMEEASSNVGDDDATFGEWGLTSLDAVEFAYRLGRQFGTTISPTLMYSHPTVSALTKHIAKVWRPDGGMTDELHR